MVFLFLFLLEMLNNKNIIDMNINTDYYFFVTLCRHADDFKGILQ